MSGELVRKKMNYAHTYEREAEEGREKKYTRIENIMKERENVVWWGYKVL